MKDEQVRLGAANSFVERRNGEEKWSSGVAGLSVRRRGDDTVTAAEWEKPEIRRLRGGSKLVGRGFIGHRRGANVGDHARGFPALFRRYFFRR
jgi:hypothetical protein